MAAPVSELSFSLTSRNASWNRDEGVLSLLAPVHRASGGASPDAPGIAGLTLFPRGRFLADGRRVPGRRTDMWNRPFRRMACGTGLALLPLPWGQRRCR